MEQGSISVLVGQRPWIGRVGGGTHRPRCKRAHVHGIGFVRAALYGLTALAATEQQYEDRRRFSRVTGPIFCRRSIWLLCA